MEQNEQFSVILFDLKTYENSTCIIDANFYVGSIVMAYQKKHGIDNLKFSITFIFNSIPMRNDLRFRYYDFFPQMKIATISVAISRINILVKIKHKTKLTVFHFIPMDACKTWGDLLYQYARRVNIPLSEIRLRYQGIMVFNMGKRLSISNIQEKDTIIAHHRSFAICNEISPCFSSLSKKI